MCIVIIYFGFRKGICCREQELSGRCGKRLPFLLKVMIEVLDYGREEGLSRSGRRHPHRKTVVPCDR